MPDQQTFIHTEYNVVNIGGFFRHLSNRLYWKEIGKLERILMQFINELTNSNILKKRTHGLFLNV